MTKTNTPDSVKVDPHKYYNLSGIAVIPKHTNMEIANPTDHNLSGNELMDLAGKQAKLIKDLEASQEAIYKRVIALTTGKTIEQELFRELQDYVK